MTLVAYIFVLLFAFEVFLEPLPTFFCAYLSQCSLWTLLGVSFIFDRVHLAALTVYTFTSFHCSYSLHS